LIWLESLPSQTSEALRPLWRVSDGSLKRVLTLGRDLQPISPSPISRRRVSRYFLIAGPEHFFDGLSNQSLRYHALVTGRKNREIGAAERQHCMTCDDPYRHTEKPRCAEGKKHRHWQQQVEGQATKDDRSNPKISKPLSRYGILIMKPFDMLKDLQRKHDWVFKVLRYSSLDRLIKTDGRGDHQARRSDLCRICSVIIFSLLVRIEGDVILAAQD